MQNRFSLECIDQSLFVLATQILLVFFSEQNSSLQPVYPQLLINLDCEVFTGYRSVNTARPKSGIFP